MCIQRVGWPSKRQLAIGQSRRWTKNNACTGVGGLSSFSCGPKLLLCCNTKQHKAASNTKRSPLQRGEHSVSMFVPFFVCLWFVYSAEVVDKGSSRWTPVPSYVHRFVGAAASLPDFVP